MKKIGIVVFICLTSAIGLAQPISLQPGSSVVIGGELVSCQGAPEENLPPACSIRQDGSYYRLYAGAAIAETFGSFAEAVAGARKMKEAGLCR